MNDKEFVRRYFESQRPMTKKEEYEYHKTQMKQYQSRLFPMTPTVDIGKTLEKMIKEEK